MHQEGKDGKGEGKNMGKNEEIPQTKVSTYVLCPREIC